MGIIYRFFRDMALGVVGLIAIIAAIAFTAAIAAGFLLILVLYLKGQISFWLLFFVYMFIVTLVVRFLEWVW